MSPPRLHVVVPGPLDQRTGGYRYGARIVVGLERSGWDVRVHCLEGSFPGDEDPRARASLAGTLDRIPDGARVVLDGLAMGGLPGPLAKHACRLRLVALVHHPLADETGLPPSRRRRLAALEREALGLCSGAVATSGFTAGRVASFGVPPERIRTVRPGTDPGPPAEGPAPPLPPALLCVGSVIPRKGHDVLVGALERIRAVPWTCVCAGSLDRAPGYARRVRELVAAAGLEERVRFTGECDDGALEALYRSASLFVLPSRYEGYGMALTEALARGLPVVSTTGGAVPDTVPEGVGVLVPPDDHEALAGALASLLDTPAGPGRRAGLSAAARRHAAGLPDWERASRAFARALRDLAPDEPARSGSGL